MVDTKEIMEKDSMYLAAAYKKKPIVIVEGSGAVVKDSDGNEYIDCLSGISVTNAGHAPERLVRAGYEQMKRLIHCSGLYYSIPQTQLAEKLANITPKQLRKSFFCNSGAEAIEGAVKLAKKYALSRGRSGGGLISLEGSFHGRLGLSLTLTGQAKYKKGFGNFANYPGVAYAPAPYCYRCALSYPDCGMECARKVEDIIKFHTTGDVAAFIAEPVLGEGGIIVPPNEYHSEVQRICREHNILYIADEVQTGFGRCGVMFAHELFNIEPDLMTMAKGLGGGLPIGGVISTDEVVSCLESGDHFSTFGGNPVCCAVALENIDLLMEEKLIENSKNLGKEVLSSLLELEEKYAIIGQARGKGLMIGLELVKDKQRKVPATEETQELAKFMMKHGIIVGTGGVVNNVIRIQPPLCINREQTTHTLEVIEDGIKNL
jgi:4-aminobutyrate aminotransferase